MKKARITAAICATAMTGALLTSGQFTSTTPAAQAAGAPASPAGLKTDGDSLQRALAAAPEKGLKTPFELSNGATWTSVEQARKFRHQLDASSDRVKVQTVGRSGNKQPIELISVGFPKPKPLAQAKKGSVVLFNCSIHGNEPSGREGCLQMARDMSTTNDPSWKRLLKQSTVLFTNINPDGWKANTRGNADGVDINRDFLALETPEAQTLAKIMGDWKPDVMNDLHEFGPREYYNTQALVLWPRNRNVDSRIHGLSQRMVNAYTGAQIEAGGHAVGIYGELVKDGAPFQQVAGDHQARILRNYTGMRHITGQLTETASRAVPTDDDQSATAVNRRRVTDQYASAMGTMSMMMENRRALANQSAQAAERTTQAGADRSGVIYFSGQDNMLPTDPAGVETHPMCGYQLTAAQLKDTRKTLKLHGITFKKNDAGAYVTLAQPGRSLIPLLFDERADYGITEATPVTQC
ncbi:M14 family zinc carboxypeptidase [Arthrobacter sp.]|uniref:M14 family zinc carboxypeptidase n=1 Tax=Arthrobacter sp. TaxID=1667 RepID=UPI003A959479